jgi:hypothetical protein
MLPEMGPPEVACWEYPFLDRSWETEIVEFIAAVHENRRPIGHAAGAVRVMSIIEGVYQGAWK